MDLMNRSALITGGGTGIGRALAIELARAGTRVALVGRREKPLQCTAERVREAGGQAHVIVGDVADAQTRTRALNETATQLGGLDILVNNAGCVAAGRLAQMSDDDIRRQVDVNLLSPILLTREALPLLQRSGDATIVNLSSSVALVASAFYAPYIASKAGLALFGESLRRELYGEGVHVLTVYPNATRTPMMEGTRGGPELGFFYEPAEDVAIAIVTGLRQGAIEVVRDAEKRAKLLAANREHPAEVDARLARRKAQLEAAVAGHRSM